MKTISEIAEEIGIDRQRVYRYVKKHCIAGVPKQGVIHYDDTVETGIKQHFSGDGISNDLSSDTAVISILQKELQTKNQIICEQQQTIRELTAIISAQAGSSNGNNQNQFSRHEPSRKTAPKKTSEPIRRLMNYEREKIFSRRFIEMNLLR